MFGVKMEKVDGMSSAQVVLFYSFVVGYGCIVVVIKAQPSDGMDSVGDVSYMDFNPRSPPLGNSLLAKTTTADGIASYECVERRWKLVSATADFADSSDSSLVTGSYYYQHNVSDIAAAGTWALKNNQGDSSESGSSFSKVTGEVITATSVSLFEDVLAQASSHEFSGAASRISYIQQIVTSTSNNTSSRAESLLTTSCEDDAPLQFSRYAAEYIFWTQDLVPPNVPVSMIARGRLLQGCFSTGEVEYAFNGTSWIQHSMLASLFDIPGGTLLGRFYTVSEAPGDTNFVWEFDNPNGWSVVAQPASDGMEADKFSLPWLLFDVTSNKNKSPSGSVTQVQMVSTRGGLINSADLTQNAPSSDTSHILQSSFTAVYWFYI